jgi:hypothetical protein
VGALFFRSGAPTEGRPYNLDVRPLAKPDEISSGLNTEIRSEFPHIVVVRTRRAGKAITVDETQNQTGRC